MRLAVLLIVGLNDMFEIINNEFVFNNNALTWVDFALSIVIFVLFLFLFLKVVHRKAAIIYFSVCSGLVFLSWMFSLRLLWSLALIASITGMSLFAFINIGEVRSLLANSFKSKNVRKIEEERVFDRHALYLKINDVVMSLSKQKIGAIITFEKSVPLNDMIKTGTVLNAPVTPELLLTIFYPGTRLHDGAVVIRRDFILAASVYYTPTTKPLTGKYGSRHRAAIGISEVCDAVTVVVSEETGRISIAYQGELTPVIPDNFLRVFEEYMFTKTDDAKFEDKEE